MIKGKKNNFNNKEPINLVNWDISRVCNYNCSYCCSKQTLNKNKKISNLNPYFLDAFAKNLSGIWRFCLGGGGEPFLRPNIIEIVNGLIRMGHTD